MKVHHTGCFRGGEMIGRQWLDRLRQVAPISNEGGGLLEERLG